MELSTHDVVSMSSDDVDAAAALIVPDSHCLVIAGRQDPGQLVVEVDSSDIVDVAFQHKTAPLVLVIPHTDVAVVGARHEEGQMLMKVGATYRAFSFLSHGCSTSNLAITIFML